MTSTLLDQAYPFRARGARVNNRMSNSSRRSSSGEPVQLKSPQVMLLAQR